VVPHGGGTSIELTGGSISGGFALYVAQGSSVGESSSQYDCVLSSRPGRCMFTNPAAGTWSLMIKSYADYYTGSYSGVKLAVNP
jgi:hypothetical protein